MNQQQLIAQIELMRTEALSKSLEHEDKRLNTFHAGRESALDQVLKLLEEVSSDNDN